MGRRAPLTVAAAVLAVAAAACGTVTSRSSSLRAAHPAPPSLATSLVTTGGTWAVAVLGGSAARHNNFWQLFVRPAKSATWRLVTPPGVASNGGLVLAGQPGAAGPAGRSVIAGFRPSQSLAFSPLASTRDDGTRWRAAVLDAGLADVPDALAAAPDGSLLALLASGGIQQAGPGAAAWAPLTSVHALDAAQAGRRCAPASAAAVAFSPSGVPLLAATCSRPGVVGIFSYAAGTWRPAGPPLPSSEAGRRVQVLRLTRTAAGEAALLAARSGRPAGLLAAWSRDGRRWTVSGPLGVDATAVRASGFGADGSAWVLLANGQAAAVAARGVAWRQLPRPPSGTAALAFGPAGSLDALAAGGSRLSVWRLARGSASWRQVQVLHVPVAYGSSG